VGKRKITFTCPYGIFVYQRIPFGLFNAHADFQLCMTAIFSNFIGSIKEVFMDEFFVYGGCFDLCLENVARYSIGVKKSILC